MRQPSKRIPESAEKDGALSGNGLRHHTRGRQPCIPPPADCSRDIVSIRCRWWLYIIEDLHWQPAAIEKIAIPKTRSLCRDFRSSGTFRSPVITDGESAYLAENIESIDLFDSMDRYHIDNKDGLAVITKRPNGAGCQTAT